MLIKDTLLKQRGLKGHLCRNGLKAPKSDKLTTSNMYILPAVLKENNPTELCTSTHRAVTSASKSLLLKENRIVHSGPLIVIML